MDENEINIEELNGDQEYELWGRFTKYLASEEGQEDLKNSGLRTGSLKFLPPETFNMAGRSFIAGWLAREKS